MIERQVFENTDARPDSSGYFGRFGGQFAPETLMPAINELTAAYEEAKNDPEFLGRPTGLYEATRFAEEVGGGNGPRIFLKREDLAHTGAHKINNAIGQALLAKRMGKQRIIAETGAGQHGVATATAAASAGLGEDATNELHVFPDLALPFRAAEEVGGMKGGNEPDPITIVMDAAAQA